MVEGPSRRGRFSHVDWHCRDSSVSSDVQFKELVDQSEGGFDDTFRTWEFAALDVADVVAKAFDTLGLRCLLLVE